VSKKKKGMFSWLGFGQEKEEKVTQEDSQAVEEITVESEAVESESIADAKQNEV